MGPFTLHHLSITLHQEALLAALCGAVVEACDECGSPHLLLQGHAGLGCASLHPSRFEGTIPSSHPGPARAGSAPGPHEATQAAHPQGQNNAPNAASNGVCRIGGPGTRSVCAGGCQCRVQRATS